MAKAKGLLEALDLWWHGSDNAFRTFDPKKLGSGEGGRDASYGFYFGKSPKTAESYLYEDTSINPKVFQEVFGYSLEDANKFKEQALLDYLAKHPNLTREQALDFSSNQPKESIYSFGNRDPDAMRYKSIETKTTPSAYEYGAPRDVYMRGIPSSKMINRKREGYLMGAELPPMEDMKIVDMSGEAWDEGKQALIARMARDEGYSGVVFQNMVDDAFSGSGVDDIALVFDPSDINTRQVKAINAPDIEFDKLKSGIAPTAAAGLLPTDQVQRENSLIDIAAGMQQLGYDKDRPEAQMYNYSSILPVKRHKDTGEYSPAMTGLLEDVTRGVLDVSQLLKGRDVTNPQSIWEILL